MMDPSPLYDEKVHPVDHHMRRDFTGRAKEPHTRTLRPVKYYHVDFGHACRYDLSKGAASEPVGYGGDQTVPEFKTQERCDPFPVDVYRVGNLIRQNFTHVCQHHFALFLCTHYSLQGDDDGWLKKRGFGFMKTLLQDMCQDDPTKRPTMEEVVSRFEKIVKRLSGWKLRSRVVDGDEFFLTTIFHFPAHWTKQFRLIARRVPAIPKA